MAAAAVAATTSTIYVAYIRDSFSTACLVSALLPFPPVAVVALVPWLTTKAV